MKSKITIEIDHDNQPIIMIQHVETEDVRDKLVKRFLETFRGESSWAKFQFVPSQTPNGAAMLRPITPEGLEEECKTMKAWVDHLNLNYFSGKITLGSSGATVTGTPGATISFT